MYKIVNPENMIICKKNNNNIKIYTVKILNLFLMLIRPSTSYTTTTIYESFYYLLSIEQKPKWAKSLISVKLYFQKQGTIINNNIYYIYIYILYI